MSRDTESSSTDLRKIWQRDDCLHRRLTRLHSVMLCCSTLLHVTRWRRSKLFFSKVLYHIFRPVWPSSEAKTLLLRRFYLPVLMSLFVVVTHSSRKWFPLKVCLHYTPLTGKPLVNSNGATLCILLLLLLLLLLGQ
jgi:hypothetical protein